MPALSAEEAPAAHFTELLHVTDGLDTVEPTFRVPREGLGFVVWHPLVLPTGQAISAFCNDSSPTGPNVVSLRRYCSFLFPILVSILRYSNYSNYQNPSAFDSGRG